MPEDALQARGLSKRFVSAGQPVPVLSGVDVSVPAGTSLALLGRSGSGKSTLLNLLCGLERPDTGAIWLAGEPVVSAAIAPQQQARRWAALRRQSLGVVFQEANLMPALTLLDNVRLRASLARRSQADCGRWLEHLGLEGLGDRYPDQVSGGQRQRAALAMVFAMTPSVILADEPTGSLDRQTADEVSDQLFQRQKETGCALVLATHDSELAARCDQRLDLAHLALA
ncbi:ATP-binding cassette domain-containing protein [Marinobacter salinisoli]|uniref:ATP-binding cassette domain-containing protein n=1 Tax=Marinobacter salinisoli TaxID=2769486 RepID=A0ABX7MTP5_9GAMM|nr:ATP-binding cassette domain-containing protein [Marinobacter salinisoli]QSP95757.1 ATP-binding cassette domain-containing protein [Marinobacter salinisoli]